MKKLKGLFLLVAILVTSFICSCSLNIKNPNSNVDSTTSECNVTFVVNSDDITSKIVTYEKGKKLTTDVVSKDVFNNETPTKEGYSIDMWYADKDYTVEIELPIIIENDLTLYLNWIRNTVEISYYVDNTLYETKEINEGEIPSKITNPTKDGYTFDGWYTDKNYTTQYLFNDKLSNNLKLYGRFVEGTDPIVTYKLYFYVDGSLYHTKTISSINNTTTITDPTKDSYTFDGWYTDNTYTTKFVFGSKLTSDTTIYGKFDINKYTVTFYDNLSVIQTQLVEHNDCAEELLSTVTNKENYTFNGWYTDQSLTTPVDISTYKITKNTSFYAKYTLNNVDVATLNITSYSGYNEGAYIEFDKISNVSLSDYQVYYKKSGQTTETQIDNELIRETDNGIRADIVGLASGEYTITAKLNGSSASVEKDVTVYNFDRSGYAHFNSSVGVGAYNNDGTLKDNALVVYVNEATKNTVTATINDKTYTGLVNIIKAQKNSSNPLVIRIIGRVAAATWNEITYDYSSIKSSEITDINGNVLPQESLTQDQIISGGYNTLNTEKYSMLNGLTNRIKYSERTYKDEDETIVDKYEQFDSYYNMCDIDSVSNVTIEGIGTDAEIFQWGFTWKKCNYIEVRNLTFTDYPEDACSFEGGNNSYVNTYGNYWVHNNTFNVGKNYWDVCYEQDKPSGDGATDFKYCNSITSSYNKFDSCKKTGLVGGDDKNYTRNVTFHHNYYYKVGSRLPLGRQANIHIYNNYYYDCTTAQDIRANAFVLSEYNYFYSCKVPQKVTTTSKYQYTVIKSFNDYYDSCSNESQATAVSSRTTTLDGLCKPDGTTDYTNFDTNSSLFYYDSTNKKSDVSILNTTAEVPEFVKKYAGTAGTFIGLTYSSSNEGNNNTEEEEEITSSSVITFNNFTTNNSLTANTTVNGVTIVTGSKTTAVKEYSSSKTVAGETINKYVSFGGGGSYSSLSIQFTLTQSAKITCYYSSGGGTSRTAALFNADGSIETATQGTTIGDDSVIASHTFATVEAGNYAIASSGSGINIVAIVIEYVE